MADDSAEAQRHQRRAELRNANLAAWESGGIETEGLAAGADGFNRHSLTFDTRLGISGCLLKAKHCLHQASANLPSCPRFGVGTCQRSQRSELGEVYERACLCCSGRSESLQKRRRNSWSCRSKLKKAIDPAKLDNLFQIEEEE